jgi:hypothetical protein
VLTTGDHYVPGGRECQCARMCSCVVSIFRINFRPGENVGSTSQDGGKPCIRFGQDNNSRKAPLSSFARLDSRVRLSPRNSCDREVLICWDCGWLGYSCRLLARCFSLQPLPYVRERGPGG